METFYFGEPPKLLLGAYLPAREMNDRGGAMIPCYPIIDEYLRPHGAFVRLAVQLAAEGFHVFRFDCFDRGDSRSEDNDGKLTE